MLGKGCVNVERERINVATQCRHDERNTLDHQARDERDVRPYVGLALASRRRGNPEEARQLIERGLRACGNPSELYLVLGRLLRDSDALTGAVYLEQAHERFPNDAMIRQLRAELAFAAGRPDRAREVCRAAREADPAARWANRLEAAACLAVGRPTQALEALAPIRASLGHDITGMRARPVDAG